MAIFDPDTLLDSIGVPQAPSFDPDSLLDSIGVPAGPKRRRPATLAALDDEGPNASPPMDRPGDLDSFAPSNEAGKSTRPRRDMSQLGAGLRAAGALPAMTAAPEHSPLYNVLGLDVAGDTLAGAGRSMVNTFKALPEELNRGTSGTEASLGRLARDTGQALERAADLPVFAGPRLPGAQQGILAPLYHAPAGLLRSLGAETEGIGDRQSEQADAKLKGNPEADSVLGRAVQGVPMLTGLALTGGTAGATLGMGLLGTGGGLKQAEDAGATPGQAWAAGGLQGASDALLGQLGAVPLVGKLLHGVPVEGAADAVLALAKQGGMGALQAVGQDVAHGLARKLTYAKDTGLDPAELAKNAAAQALLQGALALPGLEVGHGAGTEETKGPAPALSRPTAPSGGGGAAPFRGTWPDFLASKEMGRGDFAVLTAGGKRALRAEYDSALDAGRAEDAAVRAAAVPPRPGILAKPEPLHPAIEAAVNAVAPPAPEAGALVPEVLPASFRAEYGHEAKSIGPELTPEEIARLDAEANSPENWAGLNEAWQREARDRREEFWDQADAVRGRLGEMRAVGEEADPPPITWAADAQTRALANQQREQARRLAAKESGLSTEDFDSWLDDVESGRAVPDAPGGPLLDQGPPSAARSTSGLPAEVFNRLVEGKPLRLAKTDLERDVGQAAKGLWPTGLLRTPADVQLLHDTLAGGGDLDTAVAALAKQGPVKAERIAPPAPAVRSVETIQAEIDRLEDHLQSQGVDPVKLVQREPYRKMGLDEPGYGFSFMPPKLSDLYDERIAAEKAEAEPMAREVADRLSSVEPSPDIRRRIALALTQADLPAGLRGGTGGDHGFGEVADVVLHHLSASLGDPQETAFKVDTLPAPLAYPGVTGEPGWAPQFQLRIQSEGHLGPSQKVLDAGQRWLDALYGDAAPRIPGARRAAALPETSRDLPRSPGVAGTAVTDAGTELPFRYGLVNAPDLVTSHLRLGDGSLQPNPAFPAELQPRDRSRAASRLQVDRMVNSLDPERLAESRLASQGAPLVGPDGAVESGNARALAIAAAYQGGPQAAGYRSWLESQAPRFGLDPANVRALDQPVLVRHRLDVPGLDRARLAQEANQSDVATMSRSERAAVDAQALTPELLGQYTPNGSGDLTSPSNRAFALGFLQRTTSPAELGAVVDPRGQLSQEGQARLHAALLAGAYRDPGLVSRMSEATDDNTRSLSRALATEAPAFIGLRLGAEHGAVHPGLDLGPDIATAANKLSELRASGQRVPEYLAQGGLFGHELSPEAQRLLTLFDEFKRTPSRIAETLHRYVELATAAGDPRQGSLTAAEPPTKADLLERAAATWNQAGGLLPFEEPVHASRPEPAAVVADHLAATLPPERVAAFTPGDAGAVESPTNATALRETVAGLPAAEPAEATKGTARWLLGSALGDQELAHRLASSEDRLLSRLADPLASVAPSLAEAPPELRGYLRQAVNAYASTREAGETGPEIARLGRLLGPDAPEEVHRIASFLAENADHPEAVAQYLHRVAELHQQSGGQTGGEGELSLSHLLEMAADRDQRQAAGSVIPLESSNPVARSTVTGKPGEAGFVDLRGPRFGEASPIRRWFTREGKYAAMGDDFARQTKTWETEKDFKVKATEKRVDANVRDFGTALRDQMDLLKHADVAPPGALFGPASTTEEVHQYMRAGIMGENDLSEVSPPLQEAAVALRAHLTEQSRAYLQRPDLPATLKAVITENLDSYFPRTFERITDPRAYAKGIKRDFDAARDAGAPRGQSWKISEAADWAQQQHPDWSREDAEGYAFKLLNDDPQAAYAVARGTQAQKGAMGSESRGNLKARLGLPEELDNLLGLHADPTRSYQIGAMRAARDLATYDLHAKVAQMGSADPARPDGLTPDGQRPIFVDRPTPDLPVRVGGKGPLAEKYTSEQVAAAVRGMGSVAPALAGFQYYYMKVNGAIKTGKIAMNTPMGVARNYLSWPNLLLAGGHWVSAFPPKYAWESAKALPLAIEANLGAREGRVLAFAKKLAYSLPLANGETVGDHMFPRGQKLADLRAEVQRKTEMGVLGQSTATDDLRYYTGMQDEPTAGQQGQKIIRDMGGLWSGEHDLGKDIVFSAEKANLRWANPDLSVEETERMAKERMLATTPSRSEVSGGVRALRANPLTSPFPTFASERYRNFKNNAMIAMEDLKSTNPRQKVLGAARASGLLTATVLAGGARAVGVGAKVAVLGGAAMMLQQLWGTKNEDADALSEFLPEYLKNHQIAVSDRSGGKVRYADISPQMPITGVTDPAMALLRGIHEGGTRDGMIDAAQEFARPFLDEEFALKTALDLRANQNTGGNLFDSMTNLAREHPKDITRRQIYLPGSRVAAGQIGKYVWHQDAPAMALEAERFARANDLLPNTNSRGKRYTNQDEMAALGGVRFNTIDMNAAITGVGYQLRDALTESKRYFTGERSSSQNDPKTVLDARAAANENWKNAFEIGLKKVAAARQLKITDYAIRQNLRISGVPPLVIGQLMTGRYSALPLRMPYRQPVDYAGAGAPPASGDE